MTDPGHTWDDLVVPEETRTALRATARRARSLARTRERVASGQGSGRPRRRRRPGPVLFVGASGTGKTLATQIVAAAAEVPIQELDLRPVLAAHPADLERVVAEAFSAAETDRAIVVIDGAAPLLRPSQSADGAGADPSTDTDAVLSHLLTHISRFDGLAIVTATMARAIEPGRAERFAAVVEFPRPQIEARMEIWRRSLPANAELADGTLRYLAGWLTWTGGTIHSCCLAAAREAETEGVPLQLRHVSRVLDQGYRTTARSYSTDLEPPPPSAERSDTARRPPSPERPDTSPPSPGRSDMPPGARPRHRRRWPTIAGATAIAAALVGLVVALAAGATSGHRQTVLASGAVRVSLPSGWRREATPHPAPFGLTSALTIASPPPARGVLIIGQLAGDPAPLPRTLLSAFSPQVAPQVVRLGAVALYEYRSPSGAGVAANEGIYTMPTTAGTIIAICRPEGAARTFTTNCERVLATIRLRSGRTLPVGLSTTYARALSAVINQLNTVRSGAGRDLASARTAQGQAAAALTLARAHAQAASAVTRLDAGQARTANAGLAHALLMTADGYRALALAAAHRNLKAYQTARTALASAAQTQSSAFQQLRLLGYRLT